MKQLTACGKFLSAYGVMIVWFALMIALSGCQNFAVTDIDEAVGLTAEENGILCVKASVVKGSSRVDYNRLEVSKDQPVNSIPAEIIAAACPK